MAKYLIIGSLNADGARGLKAQGGSARRTVVEKACTSVGGKLESLHFAFGKDDVYVIVDLPDNKAAAALGLAIGGSGPVAARTVVLLTPEEVDAAVKLEVDFAPPKA